MYNTNKSKLLVERIFCKDRQLQVTNYGKGNQLQVINYEQNEISQDSHATIEKK